MWVLNATPFSLVILFGDAEQPVYVAAQQGAKRQQQGYRLVLCSFFDPVMGIDRNIHAGNLQLTDKRRLAEAAPFPEPPDILPDIDVVNLYHPVLTVGILHFIAPLCNNYRGIPEKILHENATFDVIICEKCKRQNINSTIKKHCPKTAPLNGKKEGFKKFFTTRTK